MQLFATSLYNKENITKQIIHIYTYYTQMMKLKSLTKTIQMTGMKKKAGDSGDDDDDDDV